MSPSQPPKLFARLARLGSLMLIASVTVIATPRLVAAQSIPSIWEANYQPPAGIGAPQRVEGGASRDGRRDTRILTALVPTSNQFGATLAARPTIYTHMPAAVNADVASIVEFELLDEAGQLIYLTDRLLPAETAGIVSIRLPESAPALDVDRNYQWMVRVYDRNDEVIGQTEGWIQRVDRPAQLPANLQRATAYDQAMHYAEARLWYDALAAMAIAYRENPTAEVRKSWTQLLRSAGLAEVANARLLQELSVTERQAFEL
ncbi:MAG: DUF928 domain-containing protein [Spirulinaceae cyanobacterium SM2_1_0]|nr:DUF928 domain-containing protein [Spirulinaceae cyanobacterium SM2_1_0]